MITRITNSMLTGKMMSNLYTNLTSLSKMQNQLASGRKYAHISDNPAALIYGQAARNKLSRLGHFQASVSTAQKWNVQTEAGVMELQKVMAGVYEELVNSGGAKNIDDRNNIGMAVSQMRDHFVDTLNSSFGDRFVYGGYNTPGDYVSGNASTVKPFTFDNNGNLLYNGFNTSQFDGLPVALLNITSVNVNIGGINTKVNVSDLFDMDPADPVRIAALNDPVNGLLARWEAAIGDMKYRDEFGAVTGDVYPDGLNGGPESVFAQFNLSHDYYDKDGNLLSTLTDTDVVLFMHKMMSDIISLEVGPGIDMPVTLNGLDILFFPTQDEDGNQIMRNMHSLLNEVHEKITAFDEVLRPDPNTGNMVMVREPRYSVEDLSSPLIRLVQAGQNHLLVKTAEIGGRDRRLELLESRYEADEINYNQMRSDAEDADIAEVIMHMRLAETVYQAALNAGARVIQPTLMDFLR